MITSTLMFTTIPSTASIPAGAKVEMDSMAVAAAILGVEAPAASRGAGTTAERVSAVTMT